VPGWASRRGEGAAAGGTIQRVREKQLFDHTNRVQPGYIPLSFEKADDVTIQLPLTWQVSSLPKELTKDGKIVLYVRKWRATRERCISPECCEAIC